MSRKRGDWVPFEYREFYDVPRVIVARWAGRLYLFDCAFDHASDDYPDRYVADRLPAAVPDAPRGSWAGLGPLGERVTEVPVSGVAFDETKRRAMHRAVFQSCALPGEGA